MHRKSLIFAFATTVAIGGASCADVIDVWNNALLDAIRGSGGTYSPLAPVAPGPSSRCAAMMNVGMYDVLNSVERNYEPYIGFLEMSPETNVELAMAIVAHSCIEEVYPAPTTINLDALLMAQINAVPDGPGKSGAIALGLACASQMRDLRASDGSEIDPPYIPGSEPGDWVPTPPAYLVAWGPGWSDVTPWCMNDGQQFRLSGPAGYTSMSSLLASSEYLAQYEDAKAFGALDSTVRTPYETQTALFWSNDRDGTFKPPGHLIYATQVVANDQGLSLLEKARLYALVSLGMADAAIAAWDAKYATDIDLWRPITGIQLGETDGNPATVGDPDWVPLADDPLVPIYTPPFPAWVSGHATFGAVHAAIMRNFFHTDEITFTITSDDTPGVFRTYSNFTDAAKENGRSRIFLGVHWQWDADDGYIIGTNVGDFVSANFLRRIGDLNGDGIVDGDDLGVLLAAWGDDQGAADLNDDGVVDSADLGLLLANWG